VQELGRNRPQTVDELMDVVANYATGEEAVGAFFSCEGGKGKSPVNDDEGPSRGPKKNKKISSPPRIVKGLEGPLRGPSSTRC